MRKGCLLPAGRSRSRSTRSTGGGAGLRKRRRITEEKLRELEEMVPGCHEMDVETVLRNTYDYIAFLEIQVKILKALSNLHGL